jgi:CheY-like chemotaxis protein
VKVAAMSGSLRVLIVEDEGFIAMEAEDMLRGFGFDVRASATCVSEAMQCVEAGGFDVALLDVNLRGENVFPVADALAERGIGFAFATGYGREGIRPDLRDYPVVSKPYAPQELCEALKVAAGV